MKAQILKIAGVTSEAEFYNKYPTEEAFFAAHPEAQMMKSGGNTPTNPALWSRAKAAARAKYTVYPSAYANGFASKWYKARGGGWRKAEYGGDMADGGVPNNPGFNALPDAVQQKIIENMANGGGTDNPGFNALPPYVQAKILGNMANGGQMPEAIARARFAAAGNLDQMADYGYAYGGYAPEMEQMAEGGIPERYRNMGFSKVGSKKNSTRPGKKWMVLAKKGDDYKVVHGGYDGMKDYSQHGSEKRKDNFWSRMGGKNSAKATDPFSPLYWHKRFGTWAEGGETPEMEMMLKKGGSTYSGGVWFQGGGTAAPVFGNPVYDWTKPIANPAVPLPKKIVFNADGTKTETGTFGEATTLFQVDPKQTVGAPTIAKDAGAGAPAKKAAPKDGWVAAQDALAKDAINPYSLQNVAGYAANFVDGINNYKNYQENLSKRREHYATDGMYNPNETSAMNRGQYDMYGTMAPANQSGMMSFTGMNQKYSFADGGTSPFETSDMSWIPNEIPVPVSDQPFISDAVSPMRATANAPVKDALNVRFNLDGNFQDYAQKAQTFLDKKAPGTDISGVDLAGAAQAAYQKTGKLVPVELALAQLQIEGYLAKGNKANKPQRTKNPFNVGNTDNGSVVNHNSTASGINAYYNLMTTQYLKNKSPEELLVNFTNSKGNRYATDKTYEKKLRDTIDNMKFQDGGEMELTEDEIDYIRAMGGEVEFL